MTASSTGVYSITLNSGPVLSNTKADDVHRPFLGYLRPYNDAVEAARYNVFAQVLESRTPNFPVTADAGDAQHTAYLVNLKLPAAFPSGAGTAIPAQSTVARRFYQLFPDDYDILDIVYSPSFFQNRFHFQVRNSVTGIGLPSIDSGQVYGSPARLMGISVFPLAEFFDGAGIGQQHEFGHQWINYLNAPPVASGIPHWPFSTMASGTMGFSIPPAGEGGNFPCVIVPDGSGIRLQSNPNLPVFGDLDLYLMGFLPPGQVAQQIVLNTQDSTVLSQFTGGVYSGGNTRFNVADLIANQAIGARVPAANVAPRSYRIAVALVTRDALLSPDEMAFFSLFAQRAELASPVPMAEGFLKGKVQPFALSARGLGSMFSVLTQTAKLNAAVNGADFGLRPQAPGGFASLFGVALPSGTASAPGTPLPLTLGGVSVLIDGKAAPLYYTSPTQINFQIPFETSPGTANVVVTANGFAVASSTFPIVSAAPAIVIDASGHAAALNSDGSVNRSANPAKPGTYVLVYLTGIGALSPPVATGNAAGLSTLSTAAAPYSAVVDGQPVQISFLGLAPGLVGAAQANILIPSLSAGDHMIQITVGSAISPGAFISVGSA